MHTEWDGCEWVSEMHTDGLYVTHALQIFIVIYKQGDNLKPADSFIDNYNCLQLSDIIIILLLYIDINFKINTTIAYYKIKWKWIKYYIYYLNCRIVILINYNIILTFIFWSQFTCLQQRTVQSCLRSLWMPRLQISCAPMNLLLFVVTDKLTCWTAAKRI